MKESKNKLPKVKLIIGGYPVKEEGWCGPVYEAKIFYDNTLMDSFLISRDSTKKQKTKKELYGQDMECPPGKYFAFFNKDLLKKHPNKLPAIQIADEKFGNEIKGPEGIRTNIFIHIFKKETSGCLTLKNREEYIRFLESLNKFDGLNKGEVIVEIKDRYAKTK